MPTKKILSPASIELITRVLQQYSQSQQPIDDFLRKILLESNTYAKQQDIDKTVNEISLTIDTISLAYQDMQRYKNRGLSSSIWLRDNLDQVIHVLPQTEQDAVIESLKSAMTRGNSALLSSLTNNESEANLVDELTSNSFRDLNKIAISDNLKEEIKTNTLLNVLVFDRGESQINSIDNNAAAQAFFSSPLNDAGDDDFKKVIATAMEIAKRKHLLNADLANISTVQMAAMADSGTSSAKAAYKVATGEVPVIDALDYLIDRAIARVSAVINVACQITVASVGALIGGVLGKDGMELGAEVGREVGAVAGAAVGELVTRGMVQVATVAKTVIRDVIKVGKLVARKVLSWF